MVSTGRSYRSIRADLHNHLMTDPNGMLPGFDYVVDHAHEVLGPGGIVGLVNFSHSDQKDERYERFSRSRGYKRVDLGNAVYVPDKDILIIKGQEIPVSEFGQEMHLLVLGLLSGEHLPVGLSLEKTVGLAKDKNGLIVVDHPFFKFGLGRFLEANPAIEKEVLPHVDAIEVQNGKAVYGNGRASRYFKERKQRFTHLGAINSSDGHSLEEVGTNYSVLAMPSDYEAQLKTSGDVTEHLSAALKETHYAQFGNKKVNHAHALLHVAEIIRVHGIKRIITRVNGDKGI